MRGPIDATFELIGDQGLAKLTTREVARRAGVSEASVFYHFRDKVGLLQAVLLSGLSPLKGIDADRLAPSAGQSLEETLLRIATALEAFFDRARPVIEALQADTELREQFADRMAERDLGPQRGVRLIHQYLTEMAENGAIDPGINTEAVGLLLVGACFLRNWHRHLNGPDRADVLPSTTDTARTLAQLLAPPAARPADA